MSHNIILASGSQIRATLLRNAGVNFDVQAASVDEDQLRQSLEQEGAEPRDVAEALAEAKAAMVARNNPDKLVIGCDQVLEFEGRVYSKPTNIEDARAQLCELRGKQHQLLSALVVCHENQPIWRHTGVVRLQMRDFSNAYLEGYLTRNWDSIRWSVGGYKLEEEGVRLFQRVDGDYFNVLGLPLIELLNFLMARGDLKT